MKQFITKKRFITEDEKEQICVEIYDEIALTKNRLKQLNSLYKKAILEQEELEKEHEHLEKEYYELNLIDLGKGKYYSIAIKPTLIRQKIESIKNDEYDYYNKENNEPRIIKRGEGLIKVLEEDLQDAMQDEQTLKAYKDTINDAYVKVENLLKNNKNNLYIIRKTITLNNRKIKKLEILAKEVDNSYIKNKKISVKKINLTLTNNETSSN